MSYSRVTIEDVRKIIQDSMEDTGTPTRILYFLKEYDGKRLTKRVVDAWKNKFGTNARIFHVFNNTHFEAEGIDFIVAYSDKNVIVDTKFIEDNNACYLSARQERNENRRKSLENYHALETMAHVIQNINESVETFRGLTGYGKELYENRFDLRSLFTDDVLRDKL